jgi:hypothetical protein
MKGNSNIQPIRLTRFSEREWQIKWNITRNDKTDEEGNIIESWDYEYANCKSPERSDIIEGIIRSRYSQSEVEAILSNAYDKKNMFEYLKFQTWRETAKEVADEKGVSTKQKIQVKMPLSFVLAGGKYEALADRVLKFAFPYEITIEDDVEMVTVWFNTILPEHEFIANDSDIKIKQVIFD